MTGKRDRHGRGLRGPLAQSNRLIDQPAPLRLVPLRPQYFLNCVNESLSHIEQQCPEAVLGIDICIEPVPSYAATQRLTADHDEMPLAGAIETPLNQPMRVILFERPIERRAVDRAELAVLVHHTLVEQLAAATGRSTLELDPHFYDEW